MAEEEKERIIIPGEDGEEHLFEVLFTFDVDKTENSYMVLTPVGEDGEVEVEEDVEVFAFRYEDKGEKDDDIELFPIESDQEWDMVEEMLNTFQDSEEV